MWSLTLREIYDLLRRQRRERHLSAAHICQTIANVNRNPEEHPEPFPLEMFLPAEFDEEDLVPEIPESRAQFEKARMLIARLGGEDLTVGMDIKFLGEREA